MDLELNSLQRLICQEIQTNQPKQKQKKKQRCLNNKKYSFINLLYNK